MSAHLAQVTPPSDADPRDATILVVESSAPAGHELVEQLRADRYRAALARTAEHARALARAQPIRAILLGELDTACGPLDLLEEIRRSTVGPGSHTAGATSAVLPLEEAPRSVAKPTHGSKWDEHVPVIVLSLSTGQLDLLRAFEMGADDFVARTGSGGASYLELRARLRAVLRRAEGFPAARLLRAGALEIDTRAHRVRVAGVPVVLCRLEYELLVHLARDPTGVCSKRELLRTIWNQRAGGSMRTVDTHASRLRRKLDIAGAPGLVVNVWGVGYRLV